uniref:ADF-H domain-containing protein n=1 Tax=Varanus komodoensis TaxID=61221 RepID=A0A8D2JKV7_VARKO
MESDSLVVCDVDPELTEKLKKFRFRKETNNAAIIMKIDKDRQLVVLEEEFQVFEIRSTEDLTEQWLKERLAFFR